MNIDNSSPEYQRVVDVLKSRLRSKDNCHDVIHGYAELFGSIWVFTARLVGDGGAKAIFGRALRLAVREVPLVDALQVGDDGIDFSQLEKRVTDENCSPAQAMDALTNLGVMIFETLSDITGEALTEPLLRHLEEGKQG